MLIKLIYMDIVCLNVKILINISRFAKYLAYIRNINEKKCRNMLTYIALDNQFLLPIPLE